MDDSENGARISIPWRVVAAVYVVVTTVLLSSSLLGILHAESSAAVATVAFFSTGVAAAFCFRYGARTRAVIRISILLLLIPWALLSASLPWRPNCGYFTGLYLYVVFTVPSVILAIAMSRWCTARFSRPVVWFVVLGLLCVAASVVYDIGLHPQFFTFSHVFGAILGPVYDDELFIGTGLIAFRLLTLILAGVFFTDAERVLQSGESNRLRHIRFAETGFVAFAVTLYLLSYRLGINSSASKIQRALGSTAESEHFVLYFDDNSIAGAELDYILRVQEYRHAQLQTSLGVAPNEPIAVYLYPDEETKGRLTGSRRTSVTPVWLSTPQIHMLAEQHRSTFSHELVHVFAREFGLPLINANLSIGLVEGLAVALEAPDGLPSADSQVAAAYRVTDNPVANLTTAAVTSLSPIGFWTGRGAVSYTVAGSFVSYLLSSIGVDGVKELYGTLSPQTAGGRDLDELAEAWADSLLSAADPDEAARLLAADRFSQPSLFEKRCPHYVSDAERRYRSVVDLLAAGDSTSALAQLENARDSSIVLDYLRARISMGRGDYNRAYELTDVESAPIAVRLLNVDAANILGYERGSAYDSLLQSLPPYARSARMAVTIRRLAVKRTASLEPLYSRRALACEVEAGVTHMWGCLQDHLLARNYLGASTALTNMLQSDDVAKELGGDLVAYAKESAADYALLGGDYVAADSLYRAARQSAIDGGVREVEAVLQDKLDFVRTMWD